MADKNYQVFISFKNTDSNNKKTRDSEIAQDLYEFLENQGVNVFFSEKSTLGSNYSETIDGALEQSIVLFVIGTKTEFLTSKWVRREYETYFEIHEDPNIFTITTGIKLPTALARLQNFNPESESFREDIVAACKQSNVDIDTGSYKKNQSGFEFQTIQESVDALVGVCKVYSKKKMNSRKKELLDKVEELVQKKVDRDYHISEISMSIHYAKRIQDAILPGKSFIGDSLPGFKVEVFFRPCDIVSGDFYWYKKVGNSTFVLCADGTGHGVPGAFLSILGINVLDNMHITPTMNPSEFLQLFNQKFIEVIQSRGDEELKDGFDVSLVKIDRETNKMDFAGAYHDIYVVRKGPWDEDAEENKNLRIFSSEEYPDYSLADIRSDRYNIGAGTAFVEKTFDSTYCIDLNSGDRIFLFSDGFPDQFGGPRFMKYRRKQFKRLFLGTAGLDLKKQFKTLEKEFDVWKGAQSQVDDVTIIGIEA